MTYSTDDTNWFHYNDSWQVDYEPQQGLLYMWDSYGFFVHLSYDRFLAAVVDALPEDFNQRQLDRRMRLFMESHKHLYCCIN
jgi:hypothetical protein